MLSQEYGTRKTYFLYDGDGTVAGMRHYNNGLYVGRYMFYKNLQGDIMGIYSSSGEIVAKYQYDSWGQVIAVTDNAGNPLTSSTVIGNLNPFRYRGYYYDRETGLYYLQSRYYDPGNGRFINADTIAGNTGNSTYNLFVYCANNPVNNSDPSGYWPQWIKNAVKAVANTVKKVVSAAKKVVAFVKVVIRAANGPTKEQHYARNKGQEGKIPKDAKEITGKDGKGTKDWVRQGDSGNRYHRHRNGDQGESAKDNVKFMSPNNQYEVIVNNPGSENAYIVDDPFNEGTYNFGTDQGLLHFVWDMLPYYRWGNSEADSGFDHLLNRIIGAD